MDRKYTLHMTVLVALAALAGCRDQTPTQPNAGGPGLPEASTSLSCTVLESQTWWSATTNIPLGGQSEHAHTQVCFPYMQVLGDSVRLTIVSQMHNTPGWFLRHVAVQVASSSTGTLTLKQITPDSQCTTNGCTFTTPLTVPLSSLAAGTWEFRIHTDLDKTIGGNTRIMSTNGWLACVRSCTGVVPSSTPIPSTDARGWYRDSTGVVSGYIVARFVDALPSAPVSGSWCPHLRTKQGSGTTPVTHTYISIDPHFHAVPEDSGIVVLDTAGTFNGARCINTTTLANGSHSLFIRADYIPGNHGPEAGALVIPFTVQN